MRRVRFNPRVADWDSLSGWVLHHPSATVARILQMVSIDPGHYLQGQFPCGCWPIAMGRSGDTQQCTLPVADSPSVAWIDQPAQFMCVRVVDIFYEPLQSHLKLADLFEQLSFFGLAFFLFLALFAFRKSLLAPSRSCFFYWLV